MSLRARIIAAFQSETAEHLQVIREALETPESLLEEASYLKVMRCAHTMKGGSRAVGLAVVEEYAHALESVFEAAHKSGSPPGEEALGLIHRALDLLEDATAGLTEERSTPDDSELIEELTALTQSEPKVDSSAPTALISAPPRAEPVKSAGSKDLQVVRVPRAALDRLLSLSGRALSESLMTQRTTQELRQLSQNMERLVAESDLARLQQGLRALADETQAVLEAQSQRAWAVQLANKAVQNTVNEALVVQARSVFSDLGPMVRELGASQEKLVEVRVRGLGTRTERRLLQTLWEPVVHLIRNAVDHGLQRPQERRAAGRPERCRLEFSVTTSRDRLCMVVEDDGVGFDYEKIRQRAVETGRLKAKAEPTQAQMQELVFEVGLSTAEELTELSGRGIGLSVVRDVVHSLGGTIRIDTGELGGTRFTLDVPLTFVATSLLLVECADQVFGIPSGNLNGINRVKTSELSELQGQRMVSLADGELVPIKSLAKTLGMAGAVQTVGQTLSYAILRVGSRRLALAVDGFRSHLDAVVRPMELPGPRLSWLLGGCLLDDGSVCLVTNPSHFIAGSQDSDLELAEALEEFRPAKIMVVDDSMTTRLMQTAILEGKGYEVLAARSGVEAMDILKDQTVDLVVSDIQMPEMGGLELLETIKSDEKLCKLPVVLLSSLGAREDVERGMKLGAAAYLVKQDFDQEELLRLVRQLV